MADALVAVRIDEGRFFVETEKYQELCVLSRHCIIREMPGEPQLRTPDLKVKPGESLDLPQREFKKENRGATNNYFHFPFCVVDCVDID